MTREDVDFISGMNMCDEISNEAYKKIMCHCEEQDPCEDAISRSKALKELEESAKHHANDSREEVLLRRDREIIRALPSVTPTCKKGKWIEERDDYGELTGWHCSNCYDKTGFVTTCAWSYCPNCGAKMGGEE